VHLGRSTTRHPAPVKLVWRGVWWAACGGTLGKLLSAPSVEVDGFSFLSVVFALMAIGMYIHLSWAQDQRPTPPSKAFSRKL
jgi:hypothetical protein